MTLTHESFDFEDAVREFEGAYQKAVKDLGRFNLLIFGKTGVGKSTLINALFGEEVARTGSGRPVTVKTEYFEHPSGILGIYDSEGIEVGEEGDKIIARFREIIAETRHRDLSEQIHVIWYCVLAGNQRFEDAQARFVEAFAKEGLPILIVLTQVGLRNGQVKPAVRDLERSITERELSIAPENRVFFTMATPDEFDGIEAHGLQELLDATFQVAPHGVAQAQIAAQRLDADRKVRAAFALVETWIATQRAASAEGRVSMLAQITAVFGLEFAPSLLQHMINVVVRLHDNRTLPFLPLTLLPWPVGMLVARDIRRRDAIKSARAAGEAWIRFCTRLGELGSGATAAMTAEELASVYMQEILSP